MDASIFRIGEWKRYKVNKKGITYHVIEQKYALFPNKIGKLTITSPTFTAILSSYDNSFIDIIINQSIFDNIKPINIKTNNIHLMVNAFPSPSFSSRK